MSSDADSPQPDEVPSRNGVPRLSEINEVVHDDGSVETRFSYVFDVPAPPFTFEHDTQKRLFVLLWPDGKVEKFRDNPARHLVVEPDPQTGEMRPVTKSGQPEYICLIREDREL